MTDSMRMVKLVEAPEDTKCAQYVGRCGVVRLRYDIRAFEERYYGEFVFLDDGGGLQKVRTSHCYTCSDKHRCLTFVRRGSRGGGKFVFECLNKRAPEELARWFHRHC